MLVSTGSALVNILNSSPGASGCTYGDMCLLYSNSGEEYLRRVMSAILVLRVSCLLVLDIMHISPVQVKNGKCVTQKNGWLESVDDVLSVLHLCPIKQ